MSGESKIPTTLPAKQAKFMAFIDYYHQQLVDNNIITERDSLDKFSKLFSEDITEQISFCNSFSDYEQTYVKQYKEKTKKNKVIQKQLQKKQLQQDKLFLKSYNQLKDPKKWTAFLKLHTQQLIPLLSQEQLTQDLRTQNPHLLLPLHPHNNHHNHPLYLLLTQQTPTPQSNTPPIPLPQLQQQLHPKSLKTDETVIKTEKLDEEINQLKDVKILQMGDIKYLIDNEDKVYDFETHKYINKLSEMQH